MNDELLSPMVDQHSEEQQKPRTRVLLIHPSFSVRLSTVAKRIFDLLAALLGLLLLWPLFLLTAILLKRENPGPVFYRGPRAGRGGKNFDILKFRTMRSNLDGENSMRITARDDDRITPLGHWLRDTKLNEFPQLWNVIKGEMSLVGPRPEDPEIVKTWPEEARKEILSIRPGITSPASVLYRDEENMLSNGNAMDEYLGTIVPEKLRLDQLYVRTHNFLSDIDIIVWTMVALLPRMTQKPVPENLLYFGPLSHFIRRYMTWFTVDLAVALGATSVVGILWRMSAPLDLGWITAFGLAVGISLLFGVINTLLGLRRISWNTASPYYVFELAFSSFLTTLLVFLFGYFWPSGPFLPQGMIIVTGIFAFLGFVVVRYRERLLTGLASRWLARRRQHNLIGERVLIVGAGKCGQLAGWLLQKSELSSAFSVVGIVDDDPFKYKMLIDGHPVLGSTREIPALVEKNNIGVILYSISNISPVERKRILDICCAQPVRVVVIPDLVHIIREQFLKSYKGIA